MKIYISGSIYGGRQKIDTYREIINHLENHGVEVLNKNIVDENVIEKESFQDDAEIFEDLINKIKIADLILAETTIPSLGVGYELGFADSINKKIIAIYDTNITEKISTMIRGNKKIDIIPYKNITEIKEELDKSLKLC